MGLIIGYTIVVAVLLSFIITVILANKNIIFKADSWAKRFFGHPLMIYSLKRSGSALISLALAIAVTFCLLRTRDPQNIFCFGWIDKLPTVQKEFACNNRLEQLGLNDPLLIQLLNFFGQIIPFPKEVCVAENLNNSTFVMECMQKEWMLINLGSSEKLFRGQQITEMFAGSMPYSLTIGLGGLLIQYVIGYPLGVYMAKKKNGIVDKIGNGYIVFIYSIPGLVFYYFFFMIFVNIMGLPSRFQEGNYLSYLPAILTMGFASVASISLWVRRYMLEEINSDYVKFARAKGLSENKIMFKHVLRNAIVPLVRTFPSSILGALLGSFFLEQIYSVPGFGKLLIVSIQQNDYPVTQAVVIVTALISIVSVLLGDIVTAIVDPRVSFSAKD